MKLSDESENLLKDRLMPDQMIYDHFYEKFDKVVEAFGRDRMKEEVEKFQQVMDDTAEVCQFYEKTPMEERTLAYVCVISIVSCSPGVNSCAALYC